jgi:hypothetical protein
LKRAALLMTTSSAAEANRVITAAKQRGFTEFWLTVPLHGKDLPDTALLKAVIAAGQKQGVAVYAAISLLKNETIGEPEINILGNDSTPLFESYKQYYRAEYGGDERAEYIARLLENQAEKYKNWRYLSPDEQNAQLQKVTAIASVVGLKGIVFRHVSPPGYIADLDRNSSMWPFEGMGYTLPQRLAFLRKVGYDPVDFAENTFGLDISLDLPYFLTNALDARYKEVAGRMTEDTSYLPPPQAWKKFREGRNKEMLITLFSAAKKARPTLNLLIEDRSSAFAEANTSWYGSWDVAERLPINLPFNAESDAIGLARRASKVVLLNYSRPAPTTGPVTTATISTEEATRFARSVSSVAGKAVQSWNGIVLDMNALPSAALLRLLETIPPRP